MKRIILTLAAAIAAILIVLPVNAAKPVNAKAGCSGQLVAAVNPSEAGETVTFDVGLLSAHCDYEVGIIPWDGTPSTSFVISGDFSHAFASGEYWVYLFATRNSATAPIQVTLVQQTVN